MDLLVKDINGDVKHIGMSGDGDSISPFIGKSDINQNALGFDAWGRNKVVIDHSLFHGVWTYDIPESRWKELSNGAEQTSFQNVTSINGMMNVKSIDAGAGDSVTAISRRHPRYQPNKGHLYSTALNIPNPDGQGSAMFGLFNTENGVYFECVGDGNDHRLYVKVLRDGVVEYSTDITSQLDASFDISKGHVYDIQMQWRGVGNFKFFIDLIEVHTASFLGTLSFLSTSNPALPVAYSTVSTGDIYEINVGCVDVTSEGGVQESRTYSSETTGSTLLSTGTTATAMLGYMIPESVNGKIFTRDTILRQMTSFCKDEAIHSIYISRSVHATTVANGAYWVDNTSSLNKYAIGGDGSQLDLDFTTDISEFTEIYASRQEKDFAKITTLSTHSEFVLSAGDIIIATLDSDAANSGGVTLEFDVEI